MNVLVIIGLSLIGIGLVAGIADSWLDITYDASGVIFGILSVLIGLILVGIHVFGWDQSHQHWVPAEALIARKCQTHGGTKSVAGRTIYRGETDGWIVVCNDSRVFAVKDGQYEDN